MKKYLKIYFTDDNYEEIAKETFQYFVKKNLFTTLLEKIKNNEEYTEERKRLQEQLSIAMLYFYYLSYINDPYQLMNIIKHEELYMRTYFSYNVKLFIVNDIDQKDLEDNNCLYIDCDILEMFCKIKENL